MYNMKAGNFMKYYCKKDFFSMKNYGRDITRQKKALNKRN